MNILVDCVDGEVKEGDLAGNETLASEVYSPKKAEVDGMPLEMVEKIANFFGAEATFYPMKGTRSILKIE